ncbi:cobalt-precorrin-6A reductase [Psychromonas sp. RZ22]|uniref:precorrin-6A/cobalt-precorrin-6A reductase n=1 Tax=Psychromonas algarum TaxID=2555643 RepID=UPI0010679E55|nr:precorrin-6A/cobalt-precorrin-6A reductase [Psychromonas sp. RZ22]TEW56534.1 cobalt-precorrin-6A reductase [Psychromonas sp. RZ22]
MKVLVVGGTADGRRLATQLFELGFDLIYSIAGIVRKAMVPCTSISGGFSQFGGLAKYVTAQNITHIVDATHPFAQKMSETIADVSEKLSIPAIRFHRQQWPKTEQDHWIEVLDWPEVIEQLPEQLSLFITAGQIEQTVIDALAKKAKQVLLRTAMPAKVELPENVLWLKAIGPFLLADETALLAEYKIDAIISKNSGGEATYAKIQAAAEAGIPVYQFKRPELRPLTYECDEQVGCVTLLQKFKMSLQHEV